MSLTPLTTLENQTVLNEHKHKSSIRQNYLTCVSDPSQLGLLSIACFPISAQFHQCKNLFKTKRMFLQEIEMILKHGVCIWFNYCHLYNVVVLPCNVVKVRIHTLVLAQSSNLVQGLILIHITNTSMMSSKSSK